MSGICDIYLDPEKLLVKQASVLKVEEKGTEGASETYTGSVSSSGTSVKDPEIKMERPFVYVIEEQSTGAVVFVGSISRF